MQQEDDLRALAKIMDFLRAVSIILVVMNVYWYCYTSIVEWHLNIGVVGISAKIRADESVSEVCNPRRLCRCCCS